MKINKIILFNPSSEVLEEIEAEQTTLRLALQLKKIIHDHPYHELDNGMRMIPSIFIEAINDDNEFTIKYDVITQTEGLLTLSKAESSGNKKEIEFGDITFQQLESYINEVITSPYDRLNEKYFPKPTLSTLLLSFSLWAVSIYSLAGFACAYFTDYLFYSDHLEVFEWLYISSFCFIGLFLFFYISSRKTTANTSSPTSIRSKKTPSRAKSQLAGIIISFGLSIGAVQTTAAITHFVTKQPISIVLTINDVKTYGPNAKTLCEGSLTVNDFIADICIESRAYMMISKPDMMIQAVGNASQFGMEIKAIEF